MEQLHTVEQVAQLLQLHPDTVRIWLRTGRLRGRKLGRVWRVPDGELRELSRTLGAEPNKNAEEPKTP